MSDELAAIARWTKTVTELQAGDVVRRHTGDDCRVVDVSKPRRGSHGFVTVSVTAEAVDRPGHVLMFGYMVNDLVLLAPAAVADGAIGCGCDPDQADHTCGPSAPDYDKEETE